MNETTVRDRRKMVFTIALPIMVQSIVQHIMILTDRAFLGNLHARYLASLGNVTVPYNAFLFIFFSLAIGLVVVVAQSYGAQDLKRARDVSESAFFFSTLISLGIFLSWYYGGEFILKLFGAKGIILRDAVIFVRILSFSLLLMGVDVTVTSILQGIGITRPIMIFGIVKSILNILLDWILIFGHWGFPALGLEGAAFATLTANIIGSVGIFITILFMKDLPFRLSLRRIFIPRWYLYQEALWVGLPSGTETLLWNIGQLVMARLLNQIDGMAIGIFSIVSGIQQIALLIYMGFAKAAMTMVGQYWGERNFKEAQRTGVYCQKIALYVTAFFSIVFLSVPKFLAGIFTNDPTVLARAIPLIRILAITVNFQAVNVIAGHAIRGSGDTKWMLFSQAIGTVFVISISSVMIFGLSLGLAGMYLTVMLDEGIRGGINFFRFYTGKNPIRVLLPGWRNMQQKL
ncbi:MAG TPA: MATE family efflux transporter [Bacillota bacterium]|jgi:putative MATE family efflux protein|nr:MATE family efflux transporter [Bacillota bacterium]